MKHEIYFAGGCFWGVEKYFSLIPGVLSTSVGYANGHTANPTYEEVCRKNTDHAETVKVIYDGTKITLPTLLTYFFKIIDPTSIDQQGGDRGRQYRTGVYYVDSQDEPVILGALKKLQSQHQKKIVVECLQLVHFYNAEEYHQKYLDKNPNGYCHLNPEIFTSFSRKK